MRAGVGGGDGLVFQKFYPGPVPVLDERFGCLVAT